MREHYSIRFRGENTWCWKGGIDHPTTLEITRVKYLKFRKMILIRDNYTCYNCKSTIQSLHVHHIKSRMEYPELLYDENNCITLCKSCHMKYEGKYLKKLVRKYHVLIPDV